MSCMDEAGNLPVMARYNPLSTDPGAAEPVTAAPVASVEDRPLEICSWCGLMIRWGRGPVSHAICNPCKIEFFPEVLHA